MNQKEIKELIELLVEKDITEFELERGDIKVHVKRGGPAAPVVHVAPAVSAIQPLPIAAVPSVQAVGGPAPQATTQPATPAATTAPSPTVEAPADADLYIVKSPIVGTYYEAPSPGTPPFVKVGDTKIDVAEGHNAGMWTVSIVRTGNEVGLSKEQLESLLPQERDSLIAGARKRLEATHPHYIIDAVADLMPVIDEISARIDKGERP